MSTKLELDVYQPNTAALMDVAEIYSELVKRTRWSLLSAPLTEGIRTIRSNQEGPQYEDDGLSSDEGEKNSEDEDEESPPTAPLANLFTTEPGSMEPPLSPQTPPTETPVTPTPATVMKTPQAVKSLWPGFRIPVMFPRRIGCRIYAPEGAVLLQIVMVNKLVPVPFQLTFDPYPNGLIAPIWIPSTRTLVPLRGRGITLDELKVSSRKLLNIAFALRVNWENVQEKEKKCLQVLHARELQRADSSLVPPVPALPENAPAEDVPQSVQSQDISMMIRELEDESLVYPPISRVSSSSMRSKPSDGHLRRDFKFEGKPSPRGSTSTENSDMKLLMLPDIIPPLTHSRSQSHSFIIEEDSSVLKSIMAKATEIVPDEVEGRSRVHSNASSNQDMSVFSIASVSSYGATLNSDAQDPFGYAHDGPSRPPSMDMSISLPASRSGSITVIAM
ncbi:hypothetical protein C8T65DRAFT_765078 [Cerioporus squamosus]|nr:hypothetical protein C8T65DRAFT_765078 [Cerioporus squamosus]